MRSDCLRVWQRLLLLQDEAPHLVNPLILGFVQRHSKPGAAAASNGSS